MDDELLEILESFLSEMHAQQAAKALRIAQSLVPGITAEDVLNPHDYPALAQSTDFAFEDGIASGIMSTKIAVRAFLKERRRKT